MIDLGSEKEKTEIEQDTILNNTSKSQGKMKINLLKIEKHEINRGRGFMKRIDDTKIQQWVSKH